LTWVRAACIEWVNFANETNGTLTRTPVAPNGERARWTADEHLLDQREIQLAGGPE